MSDWLTAKQASARYGVHPSTLRRWAQAGHLPVFVSPTGAVRFPADELEAWFRANVKRQKEAKA